MAKENGYHVHRIDITKLVTPVSSLLLAQCDLKYFNQYRISSYSSLTYLSDNSVESAIRFLYITTLKIKIQFYRIVVYFLIIVRKSKLTCDDPTVAGSIIYRLLNLS